MKTSSFFDYTGPGRVSIARFAPRTAPGGFRVYKALAPGPWFNSVDRAMYERLYAAQLSMLDASRVVADLTKLAAGAEPVLLCWEQKHQIEAGATFCHRHLVASWLRKEVGLQLQEL